MWFIQNEMSDKLIVPIRLHNSEEAVRQLVLNDAKYLKAIQNALSWLGFIAFWAEKIL